MRLLTLDQIAALLNQDIAVPSLPIKKCSVDSRNVKEGDLFFALPGACVDGHNFLGEVRQKGAVAAVVSKKYRKEVEDLILIPVDDPLDALQRLAHFVLKQSPSRVVAITGSVGKTTTKEFIQTLLTGSYSLAASPGNSNSQIGLPLSILNHTSGAEEIIVLEMGMTHSGQISKLIEIAPPEVAVVTSVELVHACNFDSLREIALAKAEIFQHPHTKLGILCRDILHYSEIVQNSHCPKLSFSLISPHADYCLDPKDAGHVISNLEQKRLNIESFSLPGKHNKQNLLAAITLARYLKVSWEEIQQRLHLLSLPKQRLQLQEYQGIFFINDAYNASETSVKAALDFLPNPRGLGKKIAVLGSMLELGKFSDDCHLRVGEYALGCVEECYCFGKECQPIFDSWKKAKRPVKLFDNFSELLVDLKKNLKPDDVVLLKGSQSKQLWKILEEWN